MNRMIAALTISAVSLTLSCAESPIEPTVPLALEGRKADHPGGGKGGGNGGGGDDDGGSGGSLVADVVPGDAFEPAGSVLESTCPAGAKQWHANFGHTECLIVTPDWNDASGFGSYPLTDDVRLIVEKEKGKTGRITGVTLLAQDVIGEAGVHHSTDVVAVATPIVPDKNGFTLHVHQAAVPVYRHDGHTGGDRVALIGWISIGDVVYRKQ